ncbi:MAG: PspC domain-containing protein [Candidatus Diapherotrites archaeon]
MVSTRVLHRSTNDRILGGVCGGIAEHYGLDSSIVRLGWILLSLIWGIGIVLYIAAWLIIPKK